MTSVSFQRGWRGGERAASTIANIKHPRNLIGEFRIERC